MSARELADEAKGFLYGSDGGQAADLIDALVERVEAAEADNAALRAVLEKTREAQRDWNK